MRIGPWANIKVKLIWASNAIAGIVGNIIGSHDKDCSIRGDGDWVHEVKC